MEQFAIQLDFFEEDTPDRRLNQKIDCLSSTVSAVRKSLFAKHGSLEKKYIELNLKYESMEAEIEHLKTIIRKVERSL